MADALSHTYRITALPSSVLLEGSLSMAQAAPIWSELRAATTSITGAEVAFDLSQADAIDGEIMALLVSLRADLAQRGVRATFRGANARVDLLVHLYGGDGKPKIRAPRTAESAIAHIGRGTLDAVHEAKGVIEFLGSLVFSMARIVRRPREGHWKELAPLMERAGADAIPIVLLISLLVGFVMAYQAARQLQMFGANIYVADLVGISICRELGPLMTAIIVCGRSGAGFAAEIGTMKVSEELDALRTMGLSPFSWLVVPRTIALVVVVPLLTVLADFVGILGGGLVGGISLGLSVTGYVTETRGAVHLGDVWTGLLKSVFFAVAISLISCQQGFSASGGAEAVGKRTTSSVVSSLFAIVVIDALLTMTFRVLGV